MKKLTFILSITLTLSAFAQVPSYVPTNGLVGWWPFNGNANDESGNGNNGTVNGATLTTDRNGNTNNAYYFSSTGCATRIDATINTSSITTGLTISVWLLRVGNGCIAPRVLEFYNTSGNPGTMDIGWDNTGYGNIGSYTSNGTVVFSAWTKPSDNTWTHLVYTNDGSFGRFYQDGVLFNTVSSTGNPILSGNAAFGRMNHPANDAFNGKLDDIGIWNRALTQQEITDLYNGCQLSVNTQPTNQTINVNNNVQFVTGSSDPSATYQWQTDLGVGFQNLNSIGQYSGTTNDTLTVSNVTMSNNNQPFRCITNSGSCFDTSDVAVLTVNNNVGIVEQIQQQLLVYPNPVSSTLTIENPEGLISNFVIVDTQGREVLKGALDTKLYSFQIAHLTSGIYTIIFEQKSIKEIKIIK